MEHWGYETGSRGASSHGYAGFRATRGGLDVRVFVETINRFRFPPKEFRLSYSYGDESLGDAWASTPPKLDWAEVRATPGSEPSIGKKVVLGETLTLRQIRKEVETFFDRLREFISNNPPRQPPS